MNTMAINIYKTFSINQQSGGRLYIGYAYNQSQKVVICIIIWLSA